MSLRLVTNYKLTGTRSFRLAASMLFGLYGMNLQNPGKGEMDIAVAPPGYSIVQADQAGAEALVVAYLTADGRYRQLFKCGIKPHTFLAMHIFADQWDFPAPGRDWFLSAEPAELRAHPDWKKLDALIKNSGNPYDIGKRTAHGKSYRMGPYTYRLANLKQSDGLLVLTYEECVRFLNYFNILFPEVISWQDEIELTVRATRELRNLQGYPRRFERNLTDDYIREAISWIPQSTVGVITHTAAAATAKFIDDNKLDWSICSNKHDSYATIVPDAEVMDAARHIRDQLAQTFRGRDGVEFTMGSEVQIGKNWKPAKQRKDGTWINPNGMREVKL
jgi:DNA polymerase I-like protein with 3'-5' exonuclease and polymerase domains